MPNILTASFEGNIVAIKKNTTTGLWEVTLSSGTQTALYSSLSQVYVSSCQHVLAGEPIGAVMTGDGAFIFNQYVSPQPVSNFWVDGNGRVGNGFTVDKKLISSASFISSGATQINVGSDAPGDLLVRGGDGNLERLGKGSDNQVLTTENNTLVWKDAAGFSPFPATTSVTINQGTGILITGNATQPLMEGPVWKIAVDVDYVLGLAPSYQLPVASASLLGGVRVGDNLSIDINGILSAPNPYLLPVATTTALGGIMVGNNLSIDAGGVLSALPGYSDAQARASINLLNGLTYDATAGIGVLGGTLLQDTYIDYSNYSLIFQDSLYGGNYFNIARDSFDFWSYIPGGGGDVGIDISIHSPDNPYVYLEANKRNTDGTYHGVWQDMEVYSDISFYNLTVQSVDEANLQRNTSLYLTPASISLGIGRYNSNLQGLYINTDIADALAGNIKFTEYGSTRSDGTTSKAIYVGSDGYLKYGNITMPSSYTLPAATPTVLGGVMVGSGLSVAADGTLSVTAGSYIQNQNAAAQTANGWINGAFRVGTTFTTGSLPSDPAGINGMGYYNTATNQFRGYRAGAWVSLLSGNDAILNQTASTQTADFKINGRGTMGFFTTNGTVAATAGLATPNVFANTLNAVANGDALIGLDVNPTLNVNGFTGTNGFGIRTSSMLIGYSGFPSASNLTGALNIINPTGQGIFVKATTPTSNSTIGFVSNTNNLVGMTADHVNKIFYLTDNSNGYDIKVLSSYTKTFSVYFGYGSAGLYGSYLNWPVYGDAATRWGVGQSNPQTTLDVAGNARINGTWYGTSTTTNTTVDFKALEISPTYNQYTGSTGNLYGLYYNPTLTSVLGTHYAIYTTSGFTYLGAFNDSTGIAKMVVSTNGVLSAQAIPSGGTTYTLPPATTTALGGVIVGTGLSVAANGTISVTTPATNVASITLNMGGIIHATPVTFSNSGGAWSGTTTYNTQAANTVFAGPASGAAAIPSFRQLSTTEIAEGTNQYFTSARAVTALAQPTSQILYGNGTGVISDATFTRVGGTVTIAGTTTASAAIARGLYINNTLVAAANNDVLVGLDIAPTFTNGAFTGVTNYSIRAKGDILLNGGGNIYGGTSARLQLSDAAGSTLFYGSITQLFVGNQVAYLTLQSSVGSANRFYADSTVTYLGTANTNVPIQLKVFATTMLQLMPTSGNGILQNGGTYTDNGARLQVYGSQTAAAAIGRVAYIGGTVAAAANNDVLVGLDVNPTFTNGAFTGVTNYALRTQGSGKILFNSLNDSTGVSKMVVSTNGVLSIQAAPTTYTFTNSSIVNTSSNLALSGDSLTPGNNMLYGTNASGVKGWYAQSSGGAAYTLPPATPSTLGGVMVGSGLAIDSSGLLTTNVIAFQELTLTTTGATTANGLLRAPVVAEGGIISVDIAGIDSSGNYVVRGSKKVSYLYNISGVISIKEINTIYATTTDSALAGADYTFITGTSDIRVQATGVTSRTIYWKISWKTTFINTAGV